MSDSADSAPLGTGALVVGLGRHGKPWYQSKTLRVNALFFLGALFGGSAIPGVKPQTAAVLAAAANIGLRALTGQPLVAGGALPPLPGAPLPDFPPAEGRQ